MWFALLHSPIVSSALLTRLALPVSILTLSPPLIRVRSVIRTARYAAMPAPTVQSAIMVTIFSAQLVLPVLKIVLFALQLHYALLARVATFYRAALVPSAVINARHV